MPELFDLTTDPDIPRHFAHRFFRERPAIFLPLFWAVVLGLISGLGLLRFESLPVEPLQWAIFSGCLLAGAASIGLVLFVVYQAFMRMTPLTILEISGHPLQSGGTQQLAIIQRRPRSMSSVRVSLECREDEITWIRTAGSTNQVRQLSRRRRTVSRHATVLLETREFPETGNDTSLVIREFTVPANAHPTAESLIDERRRIEDQKVQEVIWSLRMSGWTAWGIPWGETFEVIVQS